MLFLSLNFILILSFLKFSFSQSSQHSQHSQTSKDSQDLIEERKEKLRYPWSNNFKNHQQKLLQKLKHFPINILNSSLPYEFQENSQNIFYYFNHLLQNYSCFIQQKTEKLMLTKNENEDIIINLLKNLCISFNVDWWSYEWCSEKEVSQFHIEIKRKNQFKKNPLWSLGRYESTEYERDEEGQINKIIQYYYGGQICHENNHLRSSEVFLDFLTSSSSLILTLINSSIFSHSSHFPSLSFLQISFYLYRFI